MSRRRKILLIIGSLAVIAVVVPFLATAPEPEPRYNDGTLSEWLVIYEKSIMARDLAELEKSRAAVRAIGTNAIPFLLNWIRYEPPFWKRAIGGLPRAARSSVPSALIITAGSDTAKRAMLGFGILGTNATAAIPELRTMMWDTSKPATAARAIDAMSHLGSSAFPFMTEALSDTNYPHRYRIVGSLGFMAKHIGTNACLPPLAAAAHDPDSFTRDIAAKLLNQLQPAIATNASTP